jgi:cytochrome c553
MKKSLIKLVPLIAVLATSAFAQDIGEGEKIYIDYKCYSCHGYNGTNLSVPLANGLSGITVNEAVFITFLRQRADVNPPNATRAMPNYDASVLSDEMARDLYAYIKTLRDNPPEVSDDPVMQEMLDAAKADRPSGE